jgi:hypothetical protein
MKLQPIEGFIFDGFQQRLQQQFDCPVFMLSSSDKTRVGRRLLDGKPLEYPYITVFLSSGEPNSESYSSNFISRKGLVVSVEEDGGIVHRVRILPFLFEMEVNYVTNKFNGTETDNVLAFLRRWSFSRRNGALGFKIKYGLLQPGIQVVGASSVPINPREIATENITEYTVTTSATISGYMSEPETTQTSIVDTVALLEAEGLSGGQFFPFKRG